MTPKLLSHLVAEYIGVTTDVPNHVTVCETVRDIVTSFPRRCELLDVNYSVRLGRLKKLQSAVSALAKADAALSQGDRWELAGQQFDEHGYPVPVHPDLDITALVARLTAALDDARREVEEVVNWDEYERRQRRRRTGQALRKPGRRRENARDSVVHELALTFQEFYALGARDYRENLADFLNQLLATNPTIPRPKDVLALLSPDMTRPTKRASGLISQVRRRHGI